MPTTGKLASYENQIWEVIYYDGVLLRVFTCTETNLEKVSIRKDNYDD